MACGTAFYEIHFLFLFLDVMKRYEYVPCMNDIRVSHSSSPHPAHIIFTQDRRQSRNADQKSQVTVFSIAICHLLGYKWQSKILFLMIFFYVHRQY